MHITKDQTGKVASLASLQIEESDLEKYSEQLSKILDYIDKLDSLDIKGIEPTFNTSQSFFAREDQIEESLAQDEALGNATKGSEGLFLTKGVFEE